jgi:hypothetical protein
MLRKFSVVFKICRPLTSLLSIFPNNVSGNICSTVYALAEKGADIIKQDSGYAVLDKLSALSVGA